uniref:Putative secreted protein n=1 Tax=Anopheles darlingi TaxID=43151 RepID=A0A2M4DKD5_ANODA
MFRVLILCGAVASTSTVTSISWCCWWWLIEDTVYRRTVDVLIDRIPHVIDVNLDRFAILISRGIVVIDRTVH